MVMICCSSCKVTRDEDQFKSKIGRTLKTCEHCRGLRRKYASNNDNRKCEHGLSHGGYYCKDCEGKGLCPCGKTWSYCRVCDKNNLRFGSETICSCGKTGYCGKCYDPLKVLVREVVRTFRNWNIRNGFLMEDDFIDFDYIKNIFDTAKVCYFCKCDVVLFSDEGIMGKIIRLDDDKGYIKDNCVVSCTKCVNRKRF